MRRWLAAVLLGLICPASGASDLPYWVCPGEDGVEQVQDEPCADAPDAPPAGRVRVDGAQAEEAGGITTWSFWRKQIRAAVAQAKAWVEQGRESPRVQSLIHNPWLWIGFAAFLLLLAVFWLIRGAFRALYEWRDLRRARAVMNRTVELPAAKPANAGENTEPASPAPAPVAPPAGSAAQAPLTADRFSAELLGKLDLERFSELCLRLWRMQGLRAAYDPGEPLSDYPTILMQKPAAPKKPYGVCLCVPRQGEGIGAGAVNELLSVMKERHCSYGSIMTPGEITMEARDRARGKSVELKGAITLMIEIEGLSDRQRRALLDVVVLGIDPPQNQRRTNERIRIDPTL